MKILANDGIAEAGKEILESAGFEVLTTRVAQEQLSNYLNSHAVDALVVRSATQVTSEIIEQSSSLKVIGRAGVGMDNIDLISAKKKGIEVVNTPAASSDSVAELVFAHLLGGARYLHDSNRVMPLEGDQNFKQLKKAYSSGVELRGKTLGIIGFGRIGQSVARMAISLGMKVLFHDHERKHVTLQLKFFDGQEVKFTLQNQMLDQVLKHSDFISLHVPSQQNPVLGKEEFSKMKKGAGIVNASRGGSIDEVALLEAIDQDQIAFAGLDVFESEPRPEIQILMHPKVSLSPHIGGSTKEAQERIGIELAQQIIRVLKP